MVIMNTDDKTWAMTYILWICYGNKKVVDLHSVGQYVILWTVKRNENQLKDVKTLKSDI